MHFPFRRRDGRVPDIRTLLLLLVLSVYVPALLASAALVAIEFRNSWKTTEQSLLDRTAVMSRALRLRLESIDSHLMRLGQMAPADDDDLFGFDREARSVAAAAGLDSIVLTRPNGEHLVNTRLRWGEPLPRDSVPAVAETARTGKPRLLDLLRGRSTGRLIVGLARPVIREGHVLYVLIGVLDANRLQELLASTPDGWITAIVDGAGVVLTRHPDHESYIGRQITAELRAHIAAEEEGVFSARSLDGTPMLTAFRTPPSIGWTLAASVPRVQLHAPVWKNAFYLLASAAGVLALGVWLAMRLQRSIAQSVRTLVDEAITPPSSRPREPLAFDEANALRKRLHDNAVRLAQARRAVDRMHAEFERALLQQTDRRQARVAAELHDNVGSTLAGISLLAAQLRPLVGKDGNHLLDTIQQQLARASAGVRSVSRGMMPAGEQRGGLPAALDELATEFGRVDVRCTFACHGDFSRLSTEVAGHVYRIAQEAVTNAVRHGRVSRVRITLAGDDDNCRLTVDDDGLGYDPEEPRRGLGLRSMRTRAMAVEGEIEFTRSPLGGARVRLTFPAEEPHSLPDSQ